MDDDSGALRPAPAKASKDDVLQALTRILRSPVFAQSDRLGRFLRYTVERTVNDDTRGLKEYLIGIDVYDRKPPYHPSQDSIVRTEARRLRLKLGKFYESEGKHEQLIIYFRPGSYVPEFQVKVAPAGEIQANEAASPESGNSFPGIPFLVEPFEDLSATAIGAAVAKGVTEELVHSLTRAEGCHVISVNAAMRLPGQEPAAALLVRKHFVRFRFEGSVRHDAENIRVTCRLVALDGLQYWAETFDVKLGEVGMLALQESIASAVTARVMPQSTFVRPLPFAEQPPNYYHYPEYLAAERLLDSGELGSIRLALRKFQHTAPNVPRCGARALCGTVQACYDIMAQCGPDESLLESAAGAAARALEMDEQAAACHHAQASSHIMRWQLVEADQCFNTSLDLGAGPGVYSHYGEFLAAFGRFEKAAHYLLIAQKADPFTSRQKTRVVRFFYMSGRFDEAVRYFRLLDTFGRAPIMARIYEAFIKVELGQLDEARNLAVSILRECHSSLYLHALTAELLGISGDLPRAWSIAREFQLLEPQASISKYRQSALNIALGKLERAKPLLAAACAGHELEVLWLPVDPRFKSIASSSEYLQARAQLEQLAIA